MSGLLKFITCGSVDDGKSTLIGHLLYDAKLLYADQKKALELESKIGSRGGAIDYSLLLDGLMAEREQGITIDVAYRYFSTNARSFIVADTPGHEEYTRNMAVGASFSELAIILLDATKGVLVQTRRHARICALMGIRYFIFAVNKMDLAAYSESRFCEITAQIEALRDELKLEHISIIPVSATEGDNVTEKHDKMPWYKGPTVLSYLEQADVEETKEPGFYLPVQRVCRPNHTFRGFQGQIESGTLSVGDTLTVWPSGEEAKVKSILIGMEDCGSAGRGQPVTVQMDREVDVSRGCVFAKDADIHASQHITASLLWMDDDELRIGKEYMVKLGTREIVGLLTEIQYKVDVNTGAFRPASKVTKNEIALCTLYLQEPVVADAFSRHRTLGELILIDRITHMTAACGVVTDMGNVGSAHTFVYGNLKGRGDVFEEYFYGMESLNITKQKAGQHVYSPGDAIPLSGKTYRYPSDFDIIILRDAVAVAVRGGKVERIVALDAYRYDGRPVVNGRGFAVQISSQDEYDAFIKDYKQTQGKPDAELFDKWMKFETYRDIKFHDDFE
ncbi:sulfate adenylyltransferase subunit 1 [Megasphaera cerevisiae]|uniref:sulfate adenylyltransferase subunit 1 n=1 Tax=Megasphaera cerevisiae TaxID=39029 RepID=UPI0009440715|nr:GTP-binding protein [Megasphaera cerevisiae]OKY53056.1 hypothetical protein BSR42_09630 [Megasphaera cerevisiae]